MIATGWSGTESPRQATWPSGRTNTRGRSYTSVTRGSSKVTASRGKPSRFAADEKLDVSHIFEERTSKVKPRPKRSSVERPSFNQRCGARAPGQVVGL